MNTCKECKWWGDEEIPKDWAASEFKESGNGILKICSCKEGDYHNWAFVDYDTIESHAAAMTGPDFGCIHFEEK